MGEATTRPIRLEARDNFVSKSSLAFCGGAMTLMRLLQYKTTQHTSVEDLFVCRLALLDVVTSRSSILL